ncbi:MAG TPA: hypothetical protein VF623_08150 [Segetibacter sp.]
MPSQRNTIAKTGSASIILNKSPVKKSRTVAAKEIKYEDKSTGQPDLVEIFDRLKILLKAYVKGNIKVQEGTSGMYNLISTNQVELLGKIRELFFASLIIQKGYVSFYFFPVYTNPELLKELRPELIKCLKGKSCFHIRKNDHILMEQVKQALETGYKLYLEKGYL